MKFHGRVAACGKGRGIELEYHDSLHLPLLKHLLLLKTNQLCILSSIRDDYRVIPTFNRNQFSVEIYWEHEVVSAPK